MNATDKLDGLVIGEGARSWLSSFEHLYSVVAPTPDVVVCDTRRSEWGSSGGIGRFSGVKVYYHGQTQMQEWQYRDRWSERNDKPELEISSLGKVEVSIEGGKATVKVEMVNNRHGNRSTSFTFDHKEVATAPTLPESERQAFTAKVETEIARIKAQMDELWKEKPQMMANYSGMSMPMGTPSRVNYRRPSVKERMIRADIGLAVFVTEEQIDHRESTPQMRHELYVMTPEDTQARRLAEDHAYEYEGSSVIAIVDVNHEKIVVNTREGKRDLAIK